MNILLVIAAEVWGLDSLSPSRGDNFFLML